MWTAKRNYLYLGEDSPLRKTHSSKFLCCLILNILNSKPWFKSRWNNLDNLNRLFFLLYLIHRMSLFLSFPKQLETQRAENGRTVCAIFRSLIFPYWQHVEGRRAVAICFYIWTETVSDSGSHIDRAASQMIFLLVFFAFFFKFLPAFVVLNMLPLLWLAVKNGV